MGHTMLLFLPYSCAFNSTEHRWHYVKTNVKLEHDSPTLNATVIELIKTVRNNNKSAECWNNSVQQIVKGAPYLSMQSFNLQPVVFNLK